MTGRSPDSTEAEDTEKLAFLAGGPLAAVLIGMGLVPLRGFTVASNFAFVFLLLTILVAELGGRRAALATAMASTLSLDFFLTEPYLKLAIADKNDIIAFGGLALCGTVAAALASERGRRQRALETTRAFLDLLHAGVREMQEARSADQGVARLLEALRDTVPPLVAVAVRDDQGHLLASSGDAASRTPPRDVYRAEELLVAAPAARRVLPAGGARILLRAASRTVGGLDLWGDGTPLGTDCRRLLSDLAALLGARLARSAAAER